MNSKSLIGIRLTILELITQKDLSQGKYNLAHSHDFHNFKMKEHAQNFRCHYCGVMGHKNSRCYIRKTHLGYSNDESFNTNPQGPKYIWVPKVR